ncbi:hypothetical protein BY996DRAFT_6492328 [Phakopsora pachyrhizi]|nr:hypothetical protein BY996DRAFT_6492328 [Phakopsora pachyrhizi]
MTGALQDSSGWCVKKIMEMDVAEYRKVESIEDCRFNFCANEPWAGLMTKLVIEQLSKNKVATTQSESDLESSSSTESDDSGNEEPEKLEEQSSKAIEITNQSNLDSSTESEPSSDDDESDGTAIQSSNKTLSSSDLSSSIAAKLKITKCGKGKSSSSELSQPEDKNLESKAKADSYIT